MWPYFQSLREGLFANQGGHSQQGRTGSSVDGFKMSFATTISFDLKLFRLLRDLRTEGLDLPAHKAILSACSVYMFVLQYSNAIPR